MCGLQGTRYEHPMRTNKTIFVNECLTNIIVHPLISVIREIITLNESVNTNINTYIPRPATSLPLKNNL